MPDVLRINEFETDKGAINQRLLDLVDEVNKLQRQVIGLQARVKRLEDTP